MIIFITGASGAGKTTILTILKDKISNGIFYHFDDIGVPSFAEMISQYGSCEEWQKAATHLWIEKLDILKNDAYIFLEGSFNPEYVVEKLSRKNFLLICLNTPRMLREERLLKNRKAPELASQDMENFAQMLKNKTLALGGRVIDNNSKIDVVVDEIIKAIILRGENDYNSL